MKRPARAALWAALAAQAAWVGLNLAVLHRSPGVDAFGAVVLVTFGAFAALHQRQRWRPLAIVVRVVAAGDFLLAVGDRFGLLGSPGAAGVSWGSFARFVDYTRSVSAFAPGDAAPTLAVLATIAEVTCGLALLLGVRTRAAALASAGLLGIYGVSMTVSRPAAEQFHYDVFVLAAGMLVLATLDRSPPSMGRVRSRRPLPELGGVRHHFVEVGGVRVHVAESGTGEPIVLLHGFPQHWYAWHRVIPLLAERFRVVCPDLVGYGWSDAPPTGYGTADRVRWLIGLLDVLGIERAQLVGHETGGWLALVAALDHPERVSRIVVLNTVPPWTRRRRLLAHAWRNWYTGIVEQPFLGRLVLQHAPGFVRFLLRRNASDGVWERATLDEFAAALAEPPCARAAEIQHRRFVAEDIRALALGRFRGRLPTVPTLLIAGDDDFFVPPTLLTDAELGGTDVTLHVVTGVGHYLSEERPELVF